MDKVQAQDYIKSVFQSAFSPETFTRFVRDLLNEFAPKDNEYRGGSLWEAYREHIVQYRRIGKYTDPDGLELDILLVETKSSAKLDRARTALRNFVVKHLETFGKDYALVAFYSREDGGADWRFSFVKIELDTVRTESGKRKVEKDLTPAKRYSYLVGEHENSYTAQKQLLPVLTNDYSNPTVADIEQAFSIEKVTDEFFAQYKELFLKLSENQALRQALDAEKLDGNRFTKKLLGQIVFLYFLQKKGWLGVPKTESWGKGDRRFMQTLFDKADQAGQNFFGDSLQYLFYEALAKDRRGTVDPAYYPRFNCKIPFLNGGLFEADYDWEHLNLTIPNELFRNSEKNKAGDWGTGILDVFDRYNFTIKEDEPLEKEVAVDPEMLGKVFENLLDVTDRKSKGAFYTPREIVHYMCQESLIHYLDNVLNDYGHTHQALGSDQTDLFGNKHRKGQLALMEQEPAVAVPKDDLETFIRRGFLAVENDRTVEAKGRETDAYSFKLPESIRLNAQAIDDQLRDIKICDPAIGSGAFPVGLLHEIVTARLVLNTFLRDAGHTPYKLKRHAIQESIYGVDIDPSAIDIARLRLWLSLIVDEDDFYEIETLPNLDYKIVQGNSLIGLPHNIFRNPDIELMLEGLKIKFFNETDDDKKKARRTEINRTIRQLLDSAEEFTGYPINFDFKLYFSEVWHKKGGFDVVIGNPPYVSHDRFSTVEKSIFRSTFVTFEPFADLYCYFIERAIQMQNQNGILTYITSNSYLRADYGKILRRYIITENEVDSLINIDDYQVFSTAIVNSSILISQKKITRRKAKIVNSALSNEITFESYVNEFSFLYESEDFKRKTWNLVKPKELKVLKLISRGKPTLEELGTKIRLGLATGDNNAFIISEEKKKSLIQEDIRNADIIKPILRGRDIERYYFNFADIYILLTRNEVDVTKNYPVLYEYFDSLGYKFKNRGAKGKHWTNLRACAFFDDFKEEKIIWIELADKGRFALSKEEIYLLNSACFLLPPASLSSNFLLGLLNSSLIQFYLLNTAETSGMGTSRWFINHVKEFPIILVSIDQQLFLSEIVNYLTFELNSQKRKIIASYLENLADALVFELYFPAELKEAGKEIARHLGELRSLTDAMSDEEKLAVISQEFTRLYDPAHPVRNALETLDSVEEVRIIKAAVR